MLKLPTHTLPVPSCLPCLWSCQELFVAEYRVMLAERLLTSAGYDTDKEVWALEP